MNKRPDPQKSVAFWECRIWAQPDQRTVVKEPETARAYRTDPCPNTTSMCELYPCHAQVLTDSMTINVDWNLRARLRL